MAGLWTTWQQEEDVQIQSYTVITTTPQPAINHIHNRMPLILHSENIDHWIQCDTVSSHEAIKLLVPYNKPLSFHPVSSKVNSIKHNSPDCINSINDYSTIDLF